MLAPSLIVALAALVRVAWVLLVPSKPVGDFAMYLESATYLLEQGALDPEFVYMPGYVGAAALVMGLGGGLLAIKLTLGALLSAAGAGAVYGLAAAFWGRAAALAAGIAYALWPAGVAVGSVTGTDMPAGVLILGAAWALVRWGRTRPWVATAAFGLAMGLGAWVRAVTVPLAVFTVFYFRAAGATWRQAIVRSAAGALIALLVLAPWVLRNHARYGAWMLTDSHGGLTALVGANPNSDGRYSRSLNRLFKEVTGYTLLAEPHRAADRAAYALARDWSAFSGRYAAGLVALKAERLLDRERPLLYWPLYRAGVLRPGPTKAFFDRHRPALEAWTDAFWIALVVATFAGIGLAVARRRWEALAFVPIQLALAGVYALYFAEARYHLPIAALMFPVAAAVPAWIAEQATRLHRRGAGEVADRGVATGAADRPGGARAGLRRDGLAVAIALLVLLAGWPVSQAIGARLRDTHRWAAHVCRIDGHPAVCKWAPTGQGRSPIQGVHDGFGLALATGDPGSRPVAHTTLTLPPGRYTLRAHLDALPTAPPPPAAATPSPPAAATPSPPAAATPSPPAAATPSPPAAATCWIDLVPSRAKPASIPLSDLLAAGGRGETLPLEISHEHPGGPLVIALQARCPASSRAVVWLSAFEATRR